MAVTTYSMDSFSVGDYVVFQRCYSESDFAKFSTLSHDNNPLHHDANYAAHSSFGRPVVPLHLTLSPLSMVAGMIFPGEPSLYLGHEVHAARPVYYGETLRYSARIEAINVSHRTLRIRVLALRGFEIVLDAVMRVQSRAAHWSTPPALPVRNTSKPALAVITGASGEIGDAIACALAKSGWRLLLQDRGNDDRRLNLQNQLSGLHADAAFIAADLAKQEGRDALAAAIARTDDVGLIVHAASPAVTASAEELVAVNFSALRQMIDAALPNMLARQRAAIVLIGSLATEYAQPGWETYAGAKSMAANLIDSTERSYAAYGIRGLTIMPGLVTTRFSEGYRTGSSPALLPQEVAEAVLDMIADERAPGNVVTLEPGRCRRGNRSFRELKTAAAEVSPAVGANERAAGDGRAAMSPIADILRASLRHSGDIDLTNAALGITPGWDSLKHIEILLEIESALGIRFDADEIEAAHDFIALDTLCRKKVAGAGKP